MLPDKEGNKLDVMDVDKGVHDVFHISLLTKAPKDTIPGRILA